MRAWLAGLALASLVHGGEVERVDPTQFGVMVDELLADPEYRHLLRFRDGEQREKPRAPRPSREAQPGPQPAPRTKPDGAGPGWAPTLSWPDPSGLVPSLRFLVFAALAAAILWIAFLALRLFKRGAHPEDPPAPVGLVVPGSPPSDEDPDECRLRASGLARAGRYRDAIRVLLLGALTSVDRRGLIRPRQGLTNADYLRAVRREPALKRALESIVLAFDETHFGRREATAERFQDCLSHYQAGFRA